MRLSNKSHKENDKIWKLLSELGGKLKDTQDCIYRDSGDARKLGLWVKKNLDSRIVKVLNSLDKSTNIELLCNQILFSNFCERDKPVLECIKWLQDEQQHFKILTC